MQHTRLTYCQCGARRCGKQFHERRCANRGSSRRGSGRRTCRRCPSPAHAGRHGSGWRAKKTSHIIYKLVPEVMGVFQTLTCCLFCERRCGTGCLARRSWYRGRTCPNPRLWTCPSSPSPVRAARPCSAWTRGGGGGKGGYTSAGVVDTMAQVTGTDERRTHGARRRGKGCIIWHRQGTTETKRRKTQHYFVWKKINLSRTLNFP